MKANVPSIKELLAASDLIHTSLEELADGMHQATLARKEARSSRPNSSRGGLLDFGATNEEVEEHRSSMASCFDHIEVQISARFRKTLDANEAINWLSRQTAYQATVKSLRLIQRTQPHSKFSEEHARWRLASKILFHLGIYYSGIANGWTPGQMSREDWRDAKKAIDVLKRLESNNGLRLSSLFAAPDQIALIAPKWHEFATHQILLGMERGTPKRDEFVLDRTITRYFTETLVAAFGQAPTPLVKGFAALIGYETKRLDTLVPRWVADYKPRLPL